MEKLGIYLGCNIPFNAPDIEQSFRQSFPALGVEVVDLQGATCCPAWGTAPSFDIDTWLSVSGRNIALAENLKVDIMTGCNSCFGILSEAKHMLDHEPERRSFVNEALAKVNRQYQGISDVYHVAHVLHRKIGLTAIGENVRYTLKQLTVAVQPGCHLLWPTKTMKVTELNPFYPTILKELVQALGADAPHYSRLETCCGMGAMRSTNMGKSMATVKDKLISMKQEIDPDMIVTTCSSCYLQMDSAQKVLRENGEIDFTIPVFYYTQLLALCLGRDPNQVAAISETPREEIIERIQSTPRSLH